MIRQTCFALAVLSVLVSAGYPEEIEPGKTGGELVQTLREKYKPTTTLSYKNARERMFGEVDNHDGKVICVYTGQEYETPGLPPNDQEVNTEHTWPQSYFNKRLPMRSDLHHLFVTLSPVNNDRGRKPFGEIQDDRTDRWWIADEPDTFVPDASVRDGYSESVHDRFEPREAHKGNVARALSYFYVIYGDRGISPAWIAPQVETLRAWNKSDCVDDRERERNARIKVVQGNDNPFVLDETLFDRVFVSGSVIASPPTPLTAVAPPRHVADVRPAAATAASAESATGNNIRIVTWNAKELFDVEGVADRRADLKEFSEQTKPDILLIQEVTSIEVVEAIRDVVQPDARFVACSNFNPDDANEHASFEVGIISRFPLDQVIEHDPTPDGNEGPRDPDEVGLAEPLRKIGIEPIRADRGYLWARIDQLRLTISVVHLKSSRGKIGAADKLNSDQREYVIAAVAAGVNEDKSLLPGYSYLVAGDFNVGNLDKGKNGKDLVQDCLKKHCGTEDRYDDTHALLAQGLVGGLRMKNIAASITEPTFVAGFQGTGPIDNIYADGALVDQFAPAQKSASPFGSDHFAVFTELRISAPTPAFDAAPSARRTARKPLSVCSFNIQFLGNSKDRDNEALVGLVRDYDIVVVQELVAPPYEGIFPNGDAFKPDPEAAAFFDIMLANGYKFVLSEEDTGAGIKNHLNSSATEWWVAFYKPKRVQPADDLPKGFLAEDRTHHKDFERVPYAFPFRSADQSLDFVLVSVHLKPDAGPANAKRRKHELASIAAWVSENDDDEHDFIILGDMNIENNDELSTATPESFLSLNDECHPTNTNVKSRKPYDHVMFRPPFVQEMDVEYGMKVVDLVEAMRDAWTLSKPYPGDPYNHNEFRKYFSDHNPVDFRLIPQTQDDD